MNSFMLYFRLIFEMYGLYMVVVLLFEGPQAMWRSNRVAMYKMTVVVDGILTAVVDMILGSAESDNHRS